MAEMNLQIRLAARPKGFPKESDFSLVESPLPIPKKGEFLLKTRYLSVDPYMRGRMNEGHSYAPCVEIGEVMTGRVVGEVIASKHMGFSEGDIVTENLGWQAFGLSDGKDARKVDPNLAPISTALGVLGMPGMTAYFGLLALSTPQIGETVVVSGAGGAVGSLVGQIARIKGCRVVGVTGSDEKIDYVVKELGFDGAFNYKVVEDYTKRLNLFCPDGIDIYFDNVGGVITDGVFPLLNVKARVSVCGQISQYNLENPEVGPRLLWYFIVKRLKVEGFLVFDFIDRYDEGFKQMSNWLGTGELKYREDIVMGLENAPMAFLGMLKGDNIGKRLVKV